MDAQSGLGKVSGLTGHQFIYDPQTGWDPIMAWFDFHRITRPDGDEAIYNLLDKVDGLWLRGRAIVAWVVYHAYHTSSSEDSEGFDRAVEVCRASITQFLRLQEENENLSQQFGISEEMLFGLE